MIIGKPIEPMLVAESGSSESKYAQIIKKHKGKTAAEIKYDGYRIQVHKENKVSLFTRNLNELDSALFPDVANQIRNLPTGIYDGELLGLDYSSSIEGFNAVKKRVRGEVVKEMIAKYPLQVRFFDVLQLGKKSVMELPLYERRKILEQNVENLSVQEVIFTPEELKSKFDSTVELNLEGIVCKNSASLYVPGSKTQDWVKLKNFLTLDLVVLGTYKGEGKASKLPFAAIVVGTSNNGRYETIAKIGMSNKNSIEALYERIKSGITTTVPNNVIFSEEIQRKTYSGKVPDAYIVPERSGVVEVQALDITRSENWHSCGFADGMAYSLRISKFVQIRDDKTLKDINTTAQVAEIYSS